jgi:hypothetical protein
MATDAPTTPDTAELSAVAQHLDQLIAAGDPKQANALLRLLIAELRVNSRDEILPTYRVIDPSVCAPTSSVEPTGIEPVTSCLQSPREVGSLRIGCGSVQAIRASQTPLQVRRGGIGAAWASIKLPTRTGRSRIHRCVAALRL